MRYLLAALLLLGSALPAHAATEAIEVYYLPLNEARDAAASQLSDSGKIAMIPSRKLIVIEDDREHIDKAKELLKQLDQQAPQFTAVVEIDNVRSRQLQQVQASGAARIGRIAGGWMQVAIDDSRLSVGASNLHQLRISSANPGKIETGVIRSFTSQSRTWLSGYGVIKSNSVEMVPITSGFEITAWPVGNDQVRVRITPWMQRLEPTVSGRHEMLVDLGSVRTPATPPGTNPNMRYNALPEVNQPPQIEISGATTELTIPLDQQITIAASSNEARLLGDTLLGSRSGIGKRDYVIKLKVSR